MGKGVFSQRVIYSQRKSMLTEERRTYRTNTCLKRKRVLKEERKITKERDAYRGTWVRSNERGYLLKDDTQKGMLTLKVNTHKQ